MKPKPKGAPRIGLALSGGGPLGAIYEIGAPCALEESLNGINFTRLQQYVGVSAGGFIAAALANGISPRKLCASFIENDQQTAENFDPSWLRMPAYGELARLFSQEGRSNDFRQLKTELTLVATNLDSGEVEPFGRPGWDHVPISKAVQASAALPELFPPVEIDVSYYVDGVLKRTINASVALEQGVDLMLGLNPLVPFDATEPRVANVMRRGLSAEKQHIPRIVDGGLPAVLSQTFRALIHSRMVLGMRQYEHAYQQTRHMLRSRKTGLSGKLWRHGITLHHETLDDPKRHLSAPSKAPTQIRRAIASLQKIMDDLGHTVRCAAHMEAPSW